MFPIFLRLIFGSLFASLIVFLIIEGLPGDPASLMLGLEAREDTLQALRTELNLDQPLWVRYGLWLWGMVQGDFGLSFTYNVPVSDLILERLFLSLPLIFYCMGLTLLLAIPLGIYSAFHYHQRLDKLIALFTRIGIAIPNFWLGLLLIFLFSVTLGWFPAGGFQSWFSKDQSIISSMADGMYRLTLPAFALAVPQIAILARITRSTMIDVLNQDFLRTARAKGCSWRVCLWRHAFPNALIIMATLVGLQFSFLLSGTILVETLFSLPGLGRLLFQAVLQRDLITVRAVVLLMVITIMLVNFGLNRLASMLDPRLG